MSDLEQLLRDAFAAADAAVHDHHDDHDELISLVADAHPRRPRLGLARLGPVVAAAAAVVLVAGIAWAAAGRNPPLPTTPDATPTTRSGPVVSAARLQPLPGPAVTRARLLPNGHGFVVTSTRLLGTTDGTTWSDQTPPGVSPDQLTGGDAQALDDAHAWLSVPDATTSGPVTVSVYRRSDSTWRRSGATATGLVRLPGMQLSTSLSFASATSGWLSISAQVTHTPFGALLRTSDGGATWTTVTTTATGLPGVGPIRLVSPSTGWLSEPETGRTWQTRTGGATWTPFNLPAPAARARDVATLLALPQRSGPRLVTAVRYADPESGATHAVIVYSSSDAGVSWRVLVTVPKTGTADIVFAAAARQDSQTLVALNVTSADAARTWTVTVVEGGTAQPTTSSIVPADVDQLSAGDGGRLWAVAQANACVVGKADCSTSSGLFVSTDAGHDWTLVRLPA